MSCDAPLLALPYKKFLFRFDGDFTVNGVPVLLTTPDEQRQSTKAVDGDTGRAVWDAAVLMALMFDQRSELVRGKTVLELGSGLGLCGIAAVAAGATKAILTDLEYILPTTVTNVERNQCSSRVEVSALDWRQPESARIGWASVDMVIASDTIWLEALVDPFVGTLQFISQNQPEVVVLLANQRRSDLVWNKFIEVVTVQFRIEPIHVDGNLEIFKLVSKKI